MSQATSNRKKRSATTQNVKAAITVAAVAATVGGWAALSIADGAAANAAPVPQTSAPGTDQNPFSQQPGRRGRRPFFGNGAPSTGQMPGDQNPSSGGAPGDQTPSLGGSSGGQLPAPLGRSRSSR